MGTSAYLPSSQSTQLFYQNILLKQLLLARSRQPADIEAICKTYPACKISRKSAAHRGLSLSKKINLMVVFLLPSIKLAPSLNQSILFIRSFQSGRNSLEL
ncbi:MAG: hypothetical protein C0508_03245 [Cyanobacteria bacterium PR.023]|nr:hypothetical protein [Cyanobacteria bacterium PR.023]